MKRAKNGWIERLLKEKCAGLREEDRRISGLIR
jgi:hypothetical protein